MKRGDIVIYTTQPITIYDLESKGISLGTKYEVMGTFIGITGKFITICNDHGMIGDYMVERFKLLSEIREEKLIMLGL
jgi:hypothetical protein